MMMEQQEDQDFHLGFSLWRIISCTMYKFIFSSLFINFMCAIIDVYDTYDSSGMVGPGIQTVMARRGWRGE